MVQNDDKNNADRLIPIAVLVNAPVVDGDNGDRIILRPLNNTYFVISIMNDVHVNRPLIMMKTSSEWCD
jgi:hypothetical protein